MAKVPFGPIRFLRSSISFAGEVSLFLIASHELATITVSPLEIPELRRKLNNAGTTRTLLEFLF
jgi:hypothetical protein